MKNIKDMFLAESQNRFYPENWRNMKNADDLVEAIVDALSFSGIYDSICQSIENELDPHVFDEKEFKEKLANEISNAVNEYYDNEF